MKIISLVPSLTELLFDLGLKNEIVGRTKFCIHPKNLVKNVPVMGGTKNLHLHKIKACKPDLIIANKEENTQEQIEALQRDFNVLLTDVENYEEALQAIQSLGDATNKHLEAQHLTQKIIASFQTLSASKAKPKVAYLIWRNPYMSIGADTYIHSMLEKAGFENLFAEHLRYPEININDLEKADFIFLSSEPYPFQTKHIEEIQAQLPQSKCILVDGEMFSWYGSRMLHAAEYFAKLRAEHINNS